MDQQKLFVQIALHSWNTQIARAEKVFNSYSESEFYKQIAPGKNRIIYLYGHLAVYHDLLKETLGLDTGKYSVLSPLFLQNPDNQESEMPPVKELKAIWNEVHCDLKELFNNVAPEDWFKRHNAMTDADFEKDPSRNRLSVVLNRANHVAYHLGQVVLVKPENI
ncbi:DinB family protein [Mucilaginibacter frigoritolerans]|uniref:DinB family protein n=1 Tax=Mucilaginibacter frigoritolerans TaxID=652788 RepID=A0A562TVC4_9SPHI|nr:DinB family protein [Mucilaginibacter frigoritolerans]TWI97512.1 DinB family protein [Mucilaginibacter frigoritolerans]